ncbi:MAG: hypothetical protein KF799_13485 [Bdellovibrionales bacterium]|nr:hypothetical protein [Bdellovibrionales bacterium]
MRLWILALLLTAIGCGRSTNPTGDHPQRPTVPEVRQLIWGDLKCQASAVCQNPVLNIHLRNLTLFFERSFASPLSAVDSEGVVAFRCGIKIEKEWRQRFGLPQSDKDFDVIGEFALSVIAPKTCTHTTDLSSALQTYFTSTNEYKNENR